MKSVNHEQIKKTILEVLDCNNLKSILSLLSKTPSLKITAEKGRLYISTLIQPGIDPTKAPFIFSGVHLTPAALLAYQLEEIGINQDVE